MCGIAGFVRRDPNSDGAGSLTDMQRAIAHRGPDDSGTWQSVHCRAGFAHTRLAIIDPSPAGHQPMAVSDGRFTVTYNGEIYNFAALRSSLMSAGVSFRSNSDTEVILRLYEAEGPAFVQQLRGMFAFAIWDEIEGTCFLARDRFGIKPLYFHEAGGVLTFASEVRALLAAGVPADVDATAAYQYFRTGSVPEPLTLIQGVRALEAGHYMIWRDGRVRMHRYWHMHFPSSEPSPDAVAVTRAALLDSMQHHFVSDVPVGVFLSGGLDSTAIVALARQLRSGELRTFSLTFPGLALDEGDDARRTAAHFKTSHHEWAIDGTTAREMFGEFLAAADQPSIDGFNTFMVARLARKLDTKVVLSGLGGDELFGGYPSFWRVPQLAKTRQLAGASRTVRAAVRIAATLGGPRARRVPDLLSLPATLDSAYSVFRGIYTRDEASALTSYYLGKPVTAEEIGSPDAADPTPADGVSRLELSRYMRNQLLRDADVTSMASGVEVRVPFIDSALFDVVSRIPAAQRLQRGKVLLQRAVPEMPSWVINRPKRGFVLPIATWLDQKDWRGHVGHFNPPPEIAMDTWYRRWSVLSFERWLQRLRPQHA